MKLPEDQATRFCNCLNSLYMFANRKNGIAPDLYDAEARRLRDEPRAEVAEAIWSNPEPIIDEYLAVNPYNLPGEDLAQIASWKDALTGKFFLATTGPGLALLQRGGVTFGVWGITQEISELIKAPNMVDITLLPFEGRIVYALQLIMYPISFGDGMQKAMAEWVQEAKEAAAVAGADEFIEQSKRIRKQEAEESFARLEEEMHREYDRAHGIQIEPSEGRHVGALSGLSEDERFERAMEHFKNDAGLDSLFQEFEQMNLDDAFDCAVFHAPLKSVRELVELIRKRANMEGRYDDTPSLKKELLDRLRAAGNEECDYFAAALAEQPESFFEDLAMSGAEGYSAEKLLDDLTYRNPDTVELLRCLWESELAIEATEDEVAEGVFRGAEGLEPFGRLFYYKGTYTAVLFEEYAPVFDDVDWDELDSRLSAVEAADATAETMAYYCGIAEVRHVYEQFRAWYPSLDIWGGEERFACGLRRIARRFPIDLAGYSVSDLTLEQDMLPVIISLDLLEGCGMLEEDEPTDEDIANLDRVLEYLQGRHEEVGFHLLSVEMRDVHPADYALGLPAAKRLEAFMDARVPDSENDYSYARVFVRQAIDILRDGTRPDKVMKELLEDEEGVVNLSMEELRECVECFMNLGNSLPNWLNYGTAPDTLLAAELGQKVFRDELGRMKKVGRNDPCPCGSGKKYKKCCG